MDEQLEIALKGGDFKRLFEVQFEEIKNKYCLKKVEIEVIFYLSKCGSEDTPTDITYRLNLNKGHVSQAIDSLLQKDLIKSTPDARDRRCMHYTITSKAASIIEEIARTKKNMDEMVFKGITKEEMEIYKRITEKMLKNIRDINRKNN